LYPQICTKVLEKSANPQWNQCLSMPIRVRTTLLPTNYISALQGSANHITPLQTGREQRLMPLFCFPLVSLHV
jgi:hypothetical protein